MADAVLKMSLHRPIRASPMRPDRAVTLRAPQLSLCVTGERLVYRDGVPSLVGPQLAVFNHSARMARAGPTMQVREIAFGGSGNFRLTHSAIWRVGAHPEKCTDGRGQLDRRGQGGSNRH